MIGHYEAVAISSVYVTRRHVSVSGVSISLSPNHAIGGPSFPPSVAYGRAENRRSAGTERAGS